MFEWLNKPMSSAAAAIYGTECYDNIFNKQRSGLVMQTDDAAQGTRDAARCLAARTFHDTTTQFDEEDVDKSCCRYRFDYVKEGAGCCSWP